MKTFFFLQMHKKIDFDFHKMVATIETEKMTLIKTDVLKWNGLNIPINVSPKSVEVLNTATTITELEYGYCYYLWHW